MRTGVSHMHKNQNLILGGYVISGHSGLLNVKTEYRTIFHFVLELLLSKLSNLFYQNLKAIKAAKNRNL